MLVLGTQELVAAVWNDVVQSSKYKGVARQEAAEFCQRVWRVELDGTTLDCLPRD